MKLANSIIAMACATALSALLLSGCGSSAGTATSDSTDLSKENIEAALNLANNEAQEWTYNSDADAWTLSVVTAVVAPEIEDEQGGSVCVPGAYVTGIDTDADGTADVTADSVTEAVQGSLVIDDNAQVTSTNGQVYTASTAPVIVNTGAAGYSEQQNQTAASTYASEGYVNVACGNRGKQSTLEDGSYTGDAPCCLVDQKNAVRFVKYNILLGNLPGSVDYFVSTGGSGGGAHATMLAATSNNPDFYDYEAAAGAVGVYKNDDGSFSTTVTINGEEVELSDGMWGCIAYSAITPLAEADMDLAFEYYLDADYSFSTSFQKQLAQYLSAEYMEYVNAQNLAVKESDASVDINGDGDTKDNVVLEIEYDEKKYSETNGYGGTYLDFYQAKFEQSLETYLSNLDYATDWTWFDEDGEALSDETVASMSAADKAEAFIEGRYAKGSSGSGMGGPGGGQGGPSGMGGKADFADGNSQGAGQAPNGNPPSGNPPSGNPPSGSPEGNKGSDATADKSSDASQQNVPDAQNSGAGSSENGSGEVGTPDAGTTQATGSGTDSANYASYEDMLAAYEADIAEIEAGDAYGNNIVELYNPMNYIGAEGTEDPTWTRVLMGASEGDMSMFASMNMQIAWLNAGTDAQVEWQWDGGHVPSEILGDSFALYVDQMYGEYVDGAKKIEKAAAEKQTTNGDAEEATGTDISSWASYSGGEVELDLVDIASYRTAGAAKATPGFDTIDYGQEDYVFGSSTADARHWDKYLLKVLQDNADELSKLFNAS